MLTNFFSSFKASERIEMLNWISAVPYKHHHNENRKAILEGSGLWLFERDEFCEWRKSSASSIFWLHGIREWLEVLLFASFGADTCFLSTAGAGKTKLVYETSLYLTSDSHRITNSRL